MAERLQMQPIARLMTMSPADYRPESPPDPTLVSSMGYLVD